MTRLVVYFKREFQNLNFLPMSSHALLCWMLNLMFNSPDVSLFFETVRRDHSENVLTSMQTTMILVIEESDDISSELLSTLLNTSRRDKGDVLLTAEKLAEKVMSNCASKL